MICLECHTTGATSTVQEFGGSTTLMFCRPFYDEEGRRHHHDRNIRTHEYRCSRGHHWTTKSTGVCWCGWGVSTEPSSTGDK